MPANTVVFQHFNFPCMGHLATFLDRRGITYDVKVYSEFDIGDATDFAEAEMLILLGSPDSVNDDAEWVGAVRSVVARHLDKGKPAFGICFGAQMIASAVGAQIVSLECPRLGFHQLGHSHDSLSGNWLCFHEEHVIPLRKMEPLLVDSGTVYAFRHGSAIGLQFHPEMDIYVLESIAHALGENNPLYADLMKVTVEFDESSRERSLELFSHVFDTLRI